MGKLKKYCRIRSTVMKSKALDASPYYVYMFKIIFILRKAIFYVDFKIQRRVVQERSDM